MKVAWEPVRAEIVAKAALMTVAVRPVEDAVTAPYATERELVATRSPVMRRPWAVVDASDVDVVEVRTPKVAVLPSVELA